MHDAVLTLLTVIVVLIVAVCVFPRLWLALVTAACSALWFPANNHELEGTTLIVLNKAHGVTQADLLGFAGLAAAAVAVARARRRAHTKIAGAALVVLFACLGALLAYLRG